MKIYVYLMIMLLKLLDLLELFYDYDSGIEKQYLLTHIFWP